MNHEQQRADLMRIGCQGSGFITLNIAYRAMLKSTANIAFAVSLLAVSGCTPTAGPDITTSAFGVSTASPASQAQLSSNLDTAPDQAAAVVVGANTGSSVDATNVAPDPLAATVEQQAFVPGAVPPSAMLQTALTAETSINPQAGAVESSASYVTDGIEKPIKEPGANSAPLTPSDVAGQVPAPQVEQAETAKQVAILNVSEPETAPSAAIEDPIVAPKSARAVPEKKPTLFGNLFSNAPKKQKQSLTASSDNGEVQLASLETTNTGGSDQTEAMSSLPGVNTKNLFSLDPADKNQGEESYEEEPQVQLASATAAGLARLAPNGLLKQTDRVEVGCFKPELVSVLKKIEGHYGRKVVVTSGYRSPQGNRRAGGSRHSLHMMCAAADIQVSGVGKWELAKYMRSMPGRGGVGTYCYTDSVHIDVGSERDWNWRCRRR